ncbi:MAG: DUF2660 domain-containing protein [Rickettsiaceae bacterium]
MSNLLNVALLILVGIALVYLLIKRKKAPKIKKIVVIDPEAQKVYNIQKKKTDEVKTLTMQEKIELSWQFLVNIKNQVLKKFSKPDQEKVKRAGIILAEHGMKYQHDIELEISVKREVSKTKSITKPKEKASISR